MSVNREVFQPQTARRRMPRWLRNLLLGLLALALLVFALVACQNSNQPSSLATSALAGPRLITGPLCIEEAVDVSGSMTNYTAERERAERELFTFARRELLPGDRFSEAFFAGSGKLATAPIPLASLQAPPAVPAGIDYYGTQLAPAVDALVAARPESLQCASRALVLITDGILGDDPAVLTASLESGRYNRIFAVIPSATGWGRPSELKGGALDSVVVYHFHEGGWSGRAAAFFDDALPLDVVFGEIIGSLTGQELKPAEDVTTGTAAGFSATVSTQAPSGYTQSTAFNGGA